MGAGQGEEACLLPGVGAWQTVDTKRQKMIRDVDSLWHVAGDWNHRKECDQI